MRTTRARRDRAARERPGRERALDRRRGFARESGTTSTSTGAVVEVLRRETTGQPGRSPSRFSAPASVSRSFRNVPPPAACGGSGQTSSIARGRRFGRATRARDRFAPARELRGEAVGLVGAAERSPDQANPSRARRRASPSGTTSTGTPAAASAATGPVRVPLGGREHEVGMQGSDLLGADLEPSDARDRPRLPGEVGILRDADECLPGAEREDDLGQVRGERRRRGVGLARRRIRRRRPGGCRAGTTRSQSADQDEKPEGGDCRILRSAPAWRPLSLCVSVSSRSLGMPRRMQAASYIWRAAFCAFCSSARRSFTLASSSWIWPSSSADLAAWSPRACSRRTSSDRAKGSSDLLLVEREV